MSNKCTNCGKFPFCEDDVSDEKDGICANWIKRQVINNVNWTKKKIEQDNFILANENLNSISKDKIQAEIEELKSKGKIINQTLPYCGEYKYHKEIKVLEKLLKS